MLPIGMTSKFLETSTPEGWQEVAEAGFVNFELAFDCIMAHQQSIEAMNADAVLRRSHALSAGMNISSAHLPFAFFFDFSAKDEAARKRAMEIQMDTLRMIADWQIPIAVVHASAEPIGDEERPERILWATENLAILGERARKLGVTLALEVLPRTSLGNTSEELLQLSQNGTSAKLNLDFNHLMKETHFDFIDRTAQHLITTHLSDYDLVNERHWAPGIGDVDWSGCVKRLMERGYTGQLMLEVRDAAAIPGKMASAREVMELLQDALNK